MKKPKLASGTRDFNAVTLYKRRYILQVIQQYFEQYGFEPLETPSFEQLDTLTGKYGEEGDQLIFKILNNGLDHPSKEQKVREGMELILKGQYSKDITERALRYDLTIPFARYVVLNHHDLVMPYKRYQMQPVWRADRPQKGRYREFLQCDADVIGSDSLMHEAELLSIYAKVFEKLGIPALHIQINNRKILTGLSEKIQAPDCITDMTVAIDKLDKIGWEGVSKELEEKGFHPDQIATIQEFIAIQEEDNIVALDKMELFLKNTVTGMKGIEELREVMAYVQYLVNEEQAKLIKVSFSLARGLSYYTGFIVEVKTTAVSMGSIAGGGRYDDLTGLFGLKNMSGVGISFGIDRIYDVLEELNLFPNLPISSVEVLFLNLIEEALPTLLSEVQKLREKGVPSEVFSKTSKMGQQLKYADKRKVKKTIIIGEQEWATQQAKVRDMKTGEQVEVAINELSNYLS